MNLTIDAQATPYLAAVRARLSGIPEDDLHEIVADLEQHLTEMLSEGSETLTDRLGPPDDYADELAQSAGWGAASERTPSVFGRLATLWATATATAPGTWWSRTWSDLRPGWWVVRGLIVPVMMNALYAGGGFANWVLVIFSVAVSYALGKRASGGWGWLVADRIATVVALWALFAGVINGIGVRDSSIANTYLFENPFGVVGQNGPIETFFAYDRSGKPVDVFLYDQNGQPVITEASQYLPRGAGTSPVFHFYPLDGYSAPNAAVPELGE